MKFLPVTLLALSFASAHAQFAGAAALPSRLKKGFDAITIESATKHLSYLAGPECEGRGSGQPGFQKAAEYVAAHFKAAGLKPVGDNGTYFQNVPFYRASVDPSTSFVGTEDGSTKVMGATSVTFGRLGADADKTADAIVVVSNGPSAKLENTDLLNERFVIVFENGESKELRSQIRQAFTAGVITVTTNLPANTAAVRRTKGAGSTSLNSISMSPAAAKRLAIALGASESALNPSALGAGKAETVSLAGKIHVSAKGVQEQVNVPNVVGYLEGSDPVLKKEIIGLGAHLDHLGKVNDVIYYGADDDGSGSTALLEVVSGIKASAIRPKRSLLFMAFCGEEMGLIGSGYYSDNPIFPHESMVAELQMDMVGRDSDGMQNGDAKRVDKKEENIQTMRLVGSKRISTDLHNAVLDNNKYIGFTFKWDAEDVYTRSDHYNFAKHGIPIAFLFDGFHPDYHQPSDTVDKINFVKLTNAAKLYYLTALDLADRPQRPRKDVTGG